MKCETCIYFSYGDWCTRYSTRYETASKQCSFFEEGKAQLLKENRNNEQPKREPTARSGEVN